MSHKKPGKLNTSFWETAFTGTDDTNGKKKKKIRHKKKQSKLAAMWEDKLKNETVKPTRSKSKLNADHDGYVPRLQRISAHKEHRTMMVIGASGSGKTTTLNSMMSYLWNGKYEDTFRYKLIRERKKDQSQSQTNEVNIYHLSPPALNYQLSVIDTPGFGDTRGIQYDQLILKKVKQFLETQIQYIDAVCLVIRASQSRLTSTQQYIFNQILSIFGKDIQQNIFILFTFADGGKPPALHALNQHKICFQKSFKLNNSGFELDDEPDDFGEMFWQLGMNSFRQLFQSLYQTQRSSLQLTKRVIVQRQKMNALTQRIKSQVNNINSKCEEVRKFVDLVSIYRNKVNINSNFKQQTEWQEVTAETVWTANGAVCRNNNCNACNYTCNVNISNRISDNSQMRLCDSIDSNGYCKICPNKCHWSLHKVADYVYRWRTKTGKAHEIKAIKEKYDSARNSLQKAENEIRQRTPNLLVMEQTLNELASELCMLNEDLTKIALRSDVVSQIEYLEKLIKSEELERETDWKGRCSFLVELKENQVLLNTIINQRKYNVWSKYKDLKMYIAQYA